MALSQIHDFDYLTWLFGYPQRLLCLGGKLSELEIDVEDTVSALMECSYQGRRIPVHLHQDFLRRTPKRVCQVIGDRGEIIADIAKRTLQVVDANGNTETDDRFTMLERNQLFIDEMRHFLSCLEHRETPCVTARDGANSLSVALAALESLRTGHPTEISYL